jgi:hypothetical protein
MDMNDVIISLGGVERITAPLGIDATDEQLAAHLASNVLGDNVPTLAQVKAQIPVYQALVATVQFNAVKLQFTDAVQVHLDAGAKALGYDGILSACSYATSTNLPFSVEGKSCLDWRDAVWLYCYTELAKVEAGTRPLPTVEEIISELPVRV